MPPRHWENGSMNSTNLNEIVVSVVQFGGEVKQKRGSTKGMHLFTTNEFSLAARFVLLAGPFQETCP